MNQSTVIGLLGGAIVLIGMLIMAPVNASAFFNIPGLIVVIGGTFAATCISRPFRDVYRTLRNLPQLFREEVSTLETDVGQLLQFATRYRHGNLRAAERELANIDNPFLYTGLRRVIDRGSLEDLRNALQWRISGLRSREQGRVQILQSMSVFAPAFGMLGTLFGLVHMLSALGSSGLDEIGGTMAFAMITTVYGIVASNLFFKPSGHQDGTAHRAAPDASECTHGRCPADLRKTSPDSDQGVAGRFLRTTVDTGYDPSPLELVKV